VQRYTAFFSRFFLGPTKTNVLRVPKSFAFFGNKKKLVHCVLLKSVLVLTQVK
jgi:hypothetical protein